MAPGFRTDLKLAGGGPFAPILSEVDPATGAAPGQWWIVPSTGAARVRNAAGSGWIQISAGGGVPTLAAVLAAGNAASAKITTLTDPTAAQDAATKAYVDGKIWLPASLDFSADNTTQDATTGHHGLLPKLGGGTANFLRADGTWAAPAAGAFTAAEVSKAADTTCTNNADTVIAVDTALYDPSGMLSGGKLVIPTSGRWVVGFRVGFGANGTGDRIGAIAAAGGASQTLAYIQQSAPSSSGLYMASSSVAVLTAGDTLELHVTQSSGGNLSCLGSTTTNVLNKMLWCLGPF